MKCIHEMNTPWFRCSDCGGERLVYDNDGDFVCTSCGLVKYGHVIDEKPEWNNYKDEDSSENMRCEYQDNIQNISKIRSIFIKDDEDMVSLCTTIYNITIEKIHTKGDRHQAMIAVIVYYAAKIMKRGYSTAYIIKSLGVKDSDFWDFYKTLPNYWKNERFYTDILEVDDTEQILVRMIHKLDTLDKFPTNQKQYIIKTSNKVYLLCMKYNLFDSFKTSKLLATIIYVSCRVNSIKSIKIDEISMLYGIAVSTIKKQESIIQTAFLEEKKNVNK